MKGRETLLSKVVPVLLILFTTTWAAVLFATRNHRWTNGFYVFVNQNRASVGLIVHVIGSALGACQVFAVTQIVNYIIRLRLQNDRSMSLKVLRFWVSIVNTSLQSIRSSIPILLLTTILASFVLLRVPAALWVGGLTPVPTNDTRLQGQVLVPAFPTADLPFWRASFRKDANSVVDMSLRCNWTTVNITTISQDGFSDTMISSCPAVDQAGGLIGNLITASRQYPTLHNRIDNTGWTYTGRSYGVGASPGLPNVTTLTGAKAPIDSVSYQETGYESVVNCVKNTSSAYSIIEGVIAQDRFTAGNSWTKLYEVTGQLPISPPNVTEYYGLVSKSPLNDKDNAFGWSALSDNQTNMLAVAGTGEHINFNQTVCTVEFVPTVFQVTVNASESNIVVTKLSPPATDVEPTGQYTRAVFYTLEQLARMSSLTVASSLGLPLTRNYNTLTWGRTGYNEAESLRTLRDGVTSLLDDLFVANAQSQLIITNSTTPAPLTVTYHAVKLGTDAYIIAIFATNLLVLVVVLIEAGRTRFWSDLTDFDFSDVPAVAVAASFGGKSIATAAAAATRPAGEKDDVVVKFERDALAGEGDKLVSVNTALDHHNNNNSESETETEIESNGPSPTTRQNKSRAEKYGSAKCRLVNFGHQRKREREDKRSFGSEDV